MIVKLCKDPARTTGPTDKELCLNIKLKTTAFF